jgi:hypothetical protein
MGNCIPRYFKNPQSLIHLLALLSVLLIALFIVTLVTSYLFPIYPDEIAVRVWLSRTIYDFPEKISIYPTCEGFLQKLPVMWFLPGLIEWVIHGNLGDLRILRLVGIIGELTIISILVHQLSNIECKENMVKGSKHSRSYWSVLYSTVFVIAILSIGVLPVFLVTNRQEQIVLPLVALLLAIFANIGRHAGAPIQRNKILWMVLTYLVLTSLILYSHPKGIFLSPFLILIGFQIFRMLENKMFMTFGFLAVMAMIAQSYFAWKHTFQCTTSPDLNSLLKSFYIDPAEIINNPRLFKDDLLQSLGKFHKYIKQLTFQQNVDASYLPFIPVGWSAAIANFFIKMNILVMFIFALVLLPLFYIKDILQGRLASMNLMLIVLLGCVLMGASLSLTKNWYDAGYIYVMLVIVCVFIFVGNNHKSLKQSVVVGSLIYLSCTAIFSQAIFNYRYLPAFWGGFNGPGISIKTYDYPRAISDISASSKACAIDPVLSQGVIFDDYTYLFFQKSQKPMAITYVLYLKDQALADFVAGSGSDGMVMRCTSIPKAYLPYVKKSGSVCCVPHEALLKVTKDGSSGL